MSNSEKVAHLERVADKLLLEQMAAAERGDLETVERLTPRIHMVNAVLGGALVQF